MPVNPEDEAWKQQHEGAWKRFEEDVARLKAEKRFSLPISTSQRRYTLDDYFAVEAESQLRHEFHDGEIFVMAPGSIRHGHILANLLAFLTSAFKGGPCEVFGDKMRVATPSGLYTYPDL